MFLLDARKKLDTSKLKKIRGGDPHCFEQCICDWCTCTMTDTDPKACDKVVTNIQEIQCFQLQTI